MTRHMPVFTGVLLLVLFAPITEAAEQSRLNVLFIAVDDLRPQIGCYGDPLAKTPNIDRLASHGTVFNRAYCQQAVCSPSRTSLLTGLRPDTTRIYDLQTHFRKTIPDALTLPQQFKAQGYHTQGFGKIYHGGLDDPQSWSVKHWAPGAPLFAKPESLAIVRQKEEAMRKQGTLRQRRVLERDEETGASLKVSPYKTPRGPAWEDADVPDNTFADGQVAERAIEVMREVKDKPFFLAVGFIRPHLPFVAPKKYFDMHPLDKFRVPDMQPPQDVPPIALTTWGELRQYHRMPQEGPMPEATARELIRAYYAAASYTDAQVGRVLDELERLGLREKTVVVLWGDHGWQLGEHGLWCKHTNFELATRAPLILSAPGRKGGAKTDALVEFVDIYPTLAELCGVPRPASLEGTSMAPLLEDPERPWKKAAFSQYPRGKVMGYSMRTDRYRYTEWREASGDIQAVELYDHERDPGENANIAGATESREVLLKLASQLRSGWRGAKPRAGAAADAVSR